MNRIRNIRTYVFLVCALLPIGCWAYPTSLNCIPTAETLASGELLLEVTNCGYPRLLDTESISGVCLQFGLGNQFEFGVDRYEGDDSQETYFNAKARLFEETSKRPSFSLGLMDLSSGGSPTYYGVASKAIGSIRVHLGMVRGSYTKGVMCGFEMDVTENTWLGIDFLPGKENYLRVGISRTLSPDTSILATFGIPNTRGSAQAELGITMSTKLTLIN